MRHGVNCTRVGARLSVDAQAGIVTLIVVLCCLVLDGGQSNCSHGWGCLSSEKWREIAGNRRQASRGTVAGADAGSESVISYFFLVLHN